MIHHLSDSLPTMLITQRRRLTEELKRATDDYLTNLINLNPYLGWFSWVLWRSRVAAVPCLDRRVPSRAFNASEGIPVGHSPLGRNKGTRVGRANYPPERNGALLRVPGSVYVHRACHRRHC